MTTDGTKPLLDEIALRAARSMDRGSRNYVPYSPTEFEYDITDLLFHFFPFAVLPGVRLFSPNTSKGDYGYEMDNLIHVRLGPYDQVVIVEAKRQKIRIINNRWFARYATGEKNIADQVDNHLRVVWEYIEPVARNIEVRFTAFVVSSDTDTAHRKIDGYRNADVHLCSFKELPVLLTNRFNLDSKPDQPRPEVLRIPQSGFLNLLRLSLPVEELGHPELASAIRYVERCRRSLDEGLFRLFRPTSERWVINGSAGMGKSVLLAYTAAVFCSGHELYNFQGQVALKKATDRLNTLGFAIIRDRSTIAIMAMSAKQLQSIEAWFRFFAVRFQRGDTEGEIRFRQPEFILCRDNQSFVGNGHWAALLVDEAHDLPAFAARRIAELYNGGGLYLVMACDRHQKLRFGGSDAKLVEGLDFTNKSERLRQVYRNPAPVYMASLALMFRWFASDGPKVLPTLTDMREQFGFTAEAIGDKAISVTMMSDAHPANSWSHTVASFPDVTAAYIALIQEKMGHNEVLWVRFSHEDPDFNYEHLKQHFTYHNCRTYESEEISNKYIKGQDYPIVVIEGFPRFMDQYHGDDSDAGQQGEAHMWAFRRELYLCASRATAFLYFICNVEQTPEILNIQAELRRLVQAVAVPDVINSGGTKTWRFTIERPAEVRKLDVFDDFSVSESPRLPAVGISDRRQTAVEPTESPAEEIRPPPIPEVAVPKTITPRKLASVLGEMPLKIVLELKPVMGRIVERDTPIPLEYAEQICKQRGFDLQTLLSAAIPT